jgi:uncharacterized protein YciI
MALIFNTIAIVHFFIFNISGKLAHHTTMKKLLTTIALFVFTYCAQSQTTNPAYNKQLADTLGADDYGMKNYILVILKTGNNTAADNAQKDSLFKGHMQNIYKLSHSGMLVVSGPIKENKKNYEGIFILNVKTISEASQLLNTDPAIKAGLLNTELYEWYGSAALPLYLPNHDKVRKMDF